MAWLPGRHDIAAALALLVAAGCAGDGAGWQVARGFVRDPEGRAVVLRGVNLSGSHKLPPYLDGSGPADYRRLRDEWGMNAVRFLLSWAAVEPRAGEIDAAYLDAIAERMRWAEDAGLLVVLDMHQDLYGEGFAGGDGAPRWTCDQARYAAFVPRSPWFLGYLDTNLAACFDGLWTDELGARFAAAWGAVAERLAGSPAVIGFDVINEPHWGSANLYLFEPELLMPFYLRAITAVRARAAWIPFLEPSAARNAGLGFRTRLPRFEIGAVYAPHAYDREAEAGLGFDAARRQAYLDDVAALADEARGLGGPLVIGEYGGVAAQPGIVEYMDAAYDAAAAVAAGSFYWHLGRDEGYGLLHADGSDKVELLDVVVRPAPDRVAGDPVAWSFDPAARRFELVYRPDASLSAPTLLSLPARVYPGGAEIATRTGDDGLVTVTVVPK